MPDPIRCSQPEPKFPQITIKLIKVALPDSKIANMYSQHTNLAKSWAEQQIQIANNRKYAQRPESGVLDNHKSLEYEAGNPYYSMSNYYNFHPSSPRTTNAALGPSHAMGARPSEASLQSHAGWEGYIVLDQMSQTLRCQMCQQHFRTRHEINLHFEQKEDHKTRRERDHVAGKRKRLDRSEAAQPYAPAPIGAPAKGTKSVQESDDDIMAEKKKNQLAFKDRMEAAQKQAAMEYQFRSYHVGNTVLRLKKTERSKSQSVVDEAWRQREAEEEAEAFRQEEAEDEDRINRSHVKGTVDQGSPADHASAAVGDSFPFPAQNGLTVQQGTTAYDKPRSVQASNATKNASSDHEHADWIEVKSDEKDDEEAWDIVDNDPEISEGAKKEEAKGRWFSHLAWRPRA